MIVDVNVGNDSWVAVCLEMGGSWEKAGIDEKGVLKGVLEGLGCTFGYYWVEYYRYLEDDDDWDIGLYTSSTFDNLDSMLDHLWVYGLKKPGVAGVYIEVNQHSDGENWL